MSAPELPLEEAPGPPKHVRRGNTGESITEQHHAEQATPQAIYERLMAGEALTVKAPVFGDDTGPKSLQEAFDARERALTLFEQLDPRIRRAAGDDVLRFSRMLVDEEGRQQLEDVGLRISDEEAIDFFGTGPVEAPPTEPNRPPSQPEAEPAAPPAEPTNEPPNGGA